MARIEEVTPHGKRVLSEGDNGVTVETLEEPTLTREQERAAIDAVENRASDDDRISRIERALIKAGIVIDEERES